MITFKKLLEDGETPPELPTGILNLIKRQHQIPDYLLRDLKQGEVNSSRYFAHYGCDHGRDLYIHYDVDTWLRDERGHVCKISGIVLYDDFAEWEFARMMGILFESLQHEEIKPHQNQN